LGLFSGLLVYVSAKDLEIRASSLYQPLLVVASTVVMAGVSIVILLFVIDVLIRCFKGKKKDDESKALHYIVRDAIVNEINEKDQAIFFSRAFETPYGKSLSKETKKAVKIKMKKLFGGKKSKLEAVDLTWILFVGQNISSEEETGLKDMNDILSHLISFKRVQNKINAAKAKVLNLLNKGKSKVKGTVKKSQPNKVQHGMEIELQPIDSNFGMLLNNTDEVKLVDENILNGTDLFQEREIAQQIASEDPKRKESHPVEESQKVEEVEEIQTPKARPKSAIPEIQNIEEMLQNGEIDEDEAKVLKKVYLRKSAAVNSKDIFK
jgi:hypothetical protein